MFGALGMILQVSGLMGKASGICVQDLRVRAAWRTGRRTGFETHKLPLTDQGVHLKLMQIPLLELPILNMKC